MYMSPLSHCMAPRVHKSGSGKLQFPIPRLRKDAERDRAESSCLSVLALLANRYDTRQASAAVSRDVVRYRTRDPRASSVFLANSACHFAESNSCVNLAASRSFMPARDSKALFELCRTVLDGNACPRASTCSPKQFTQR